MKTIIISLPPKYGKTYHAELEKYKRKGVYMIMIKKFLDLFFPRCQIYDSWGNYIKTKRVFVLKYLMKRR